MNFRDNGSIMPISMKNYVTELRAIASEAAQAWCDAAQQIREFRLPRLKISAHRGVIVLLTIWNVALTFLLITGTEILGRVTNEQNLHAQLAEATRQEISVLRESLKSREREAAATLAVLLEGQYRQRAGDYIQSEELLAVMNQVAALGSSGDEREARREQAKKHRQDAEEVKSILKRSEQRYKDDLDKLSRTVEKAQANPLP